MKENNNMLKSFFNRIVLFKNNYLFILTMVKNNKYKLEVHELGLRFFKKIKMHSSDVH